MRFGTYRKFDRPVINNQLGEISSQLFSEVDKARILSASSQHWLMAPPISSIRLRLSDKKIWIAVGFGLGLRTYTCEPHTCPCGKEVNAEVYTDYHADATVELNDIILRSIKLVQIPVSKEPARLSITDEKRPDGATLIPWSHDKPLACDVTVPDKFADSHLKDTLPLTFLCQWLSQHVGHRTRKPVIETIQEICRRMAKASNDPNETLYFFQRLSVAIQRGNAVSFLNTFPEERESHLDH